jgi:hypothetical protein
MKALLFLISVAAFAQTDLPGPIGALPDASIHATAVYSWNGAQTKHSGLIAGNTNAFDWTLSILDAGYTFDNIIIAKSILPATNLTYSLGDCATSATCPSGTGAKIWAIIHTQEVANYGANPLSIYSDTGLIAIDAHAAQPVQFYTTNTLRGQFKAGGAFSVVNLAGSGNRCLDTTSAGDLAVGSTVDCLDPTVPNTFTATQTFNANPGIISKSILPVTDLSYSLGDCAMSATCPSGTGAKEWAALHVQNIYNYGSNPMSIYSDTQQITVDTHGNQPIQFYTNNTHRFDILGNGNIEIFGGNIDFSNTSTIIGNAPNQAAYVQSQVFNTFDPTFTNYCTMRYDIGQQCLQGATVEYLLDGVLGTGTFHSLAGTGFRDICADSTGKIVVSGSCPSGSGVTSIGTTSPISGGPITTTGTISCPTCAVTNANNSFSTSQSFSGEIQPSTNNTYQAGDTTHNFTGVFTTNIYDYVSGTALGLTGTSSAGGVGIALATTTAADIAFYPNSAQSFTLKSGGTVRLNNLAGGGNRCLQVDNNGDITAHAAGTC